jgi:hypothetical protein
VERPYAEDLNYWRTSKQAPDTIIGKTIRLIEECDGQIIRQYFGQEGDRAAYLITFTMDGDTFDVAWPVLESKSGDTLAAKRQAATMLFHDVKSRTLAARVLGARTAFFAFLALPDGRRVSAIEADEILPALLDSSPKRLGHGETP